MLLCFSTLLEVKIAVKVKKSYRDHNASPFSFYIGLFVLPNIVFNSVQKLLICGIHVCSFQGYITRETLSAVFLEIIVHVTRFWHFPYT